MAQRPELTTASHGAPSRPAWPTGARLDAEAKRWHDANPDKVARIQRTAKVRRRARIRNLPVVPYLRSDIFERDGWVCQLCSGPIDRAAVAPDWFSPSIDHVIPISAGGGDTPGNVQASHLICNIRKGALVSA
jgi:5-methylcytosine-specific restriction endonuclease McrA